MWSLVRLSPRPGNVSRGCGGAWAVSPERTRLEVREAGSSSLEMIWTKVRRPPGLRSLVSKARVSSPWEMAARPTHPEKILVKLEAG